jgi:hypothetical protein
VDADQDSCAAFLVRSSDTIVQFDEIIAVTHHDYSETRTAKQIAHALGGIQRQIFLELKRTCASPAGAAIVLPSMTSVENNRREPTF